MGRFSGKTCRLLTMMALTTSFFLVEIITGYATKSVALIADSFHMLSDIISLIVGFTAIKMSKRTTSKNTYGWQRAEVLGALVNAVFLMALCFTIVVEAVQRFISIEKVEEPILVLIVGGIGLLINGVGLCLFSTHGLGHGHSHGGHGHGHSHKKTRTKANTQKISAQDSNGDFNYSKVSQGDTETTHQQPNGFSYSQIDATPQRNQNSVYSSEGSRNAIDMEESGVHLTIDNSSGEEHQDSSGQLNMRGVFLHVLGDALGSVVVIISATIIWLVEDEWKYYVDPAMSLAIVIIIITTTIPLFKQSSMILLQSIPTDVDIEDIEERLMRKVHGIENVHEFHIWQLSGDKIIATAHIRFRNIHDYVQAAKEMKSFLHDEGIHSTTIQPEFTDDMTDGSDDTDDNCMLMCQPQGCRTMTCCDNQTRRRKSQTGSEGKKSQTQTSPTHQFSSIWSRARQFTRVSKTPYAPVDSDNDNKSPVDYSRVPLLQNVTSPPVKETAMGTTEITAVTSSTEERV